VLIFGYFGEEFGGNISDGWQHITGGSSSKILRRGITPSILSSGSYPFSETEKIRTPHRPTFLPASFWIWGQQVNLGARASLPQCKIAPAQLVLCCWSLSITLRLTEAFWVFCVLTAKLKYRVSQGTRRIDSSMQSLRQTADYGLQIVQYNR